MVATASATGARDARRFFRPAMLAVALGLLVIPLMRLLYAVQAGQGLLGVDYRLYTDAASRWLAGGPYLDPSQIASPHLLRAGDILYPPAILWLLVPFTALPAVLWWAVPIAGLAWALWRLRPAPWAWPVMALLLTFPGWTDAYWLGPVGEGGDLDLRLPRGLGRQGAGAAARPPDGAPRIPWRHDRAHPALGPSASIRAAARLTAASISRSMSARISSSSGVGRDGAAWCAVNRVPPQDFVRASERAGAPGPSPLGPGPSSPPRPCILIAGRDSSVVAARTMKRPPRSRYGHGGHEGPSAGTGRGQAAIVRRGAMPGAMRRTAYPR